MSFFISSSIWGQKDSIYFEKAVELMQNNELDEAVKFLDKAIKINPHIPKYFRKKVYILFDKNNPKEAFQCINLGISKNKKNPHFLIIRSDLYYFSNEFSEALLDLEVAHNLAKGNQQLIPKILLSKSGSKLSTRDYNGAIRDLEEALKIDSTYIEAMINIGIAYGGKEDYNSALKYFTTAYEMAPANSIILSNLGFLFTQTKQYKKAIGIINKSIKLDSTVAERYNNRGFALLKLEKLDEAEKDILKSIELNPSNSYAYKNLALLHISRKEMEKACKALNTALNYGFKSMFGNEVDLLIQKHCK